LFLQATSRSPQSEKRGLRNIASSRLYLRQWPPPFPSPCALYTLSLRQHVLLLNLPPFFEILLYRKYDFLSVYLKAGRFFAPARLEYRLVPLRHQALYIGDSSLGLFRREVSLVSCALKISPAVLFFSLSDSIFFLRTYVQVTPLGLLFFFPSRSRGFHDTIWTATFPRFSFPIVGQCLN